MVVAFMTALPAKGLGLSGLVNRALSLPEQIGGVHRQLYGSLDERDCKVDLGLKPVSFTIIDVRLPRDCECLRAAERSIGREQV